MKDHFDKILSNKIKDSIDNQQIKYNPEHWDMLVKKKKKKKRFLFITRIAALLILLLIAGGLGNYYFDSSIENNTILPQIIKIPKDSLPSENEIQKHEIQITNIDIDTTNLKNDVIEEKKQDLIYKNKRTIDKSLLTQKNIKKNDEKLIYKDTIQNKSKDNNIPKRSIEDIVPKNNEIAKVDTIKSIKNKQLNKTIIEKNETNENKIALTEIDEIETNNDKNSKRNLKLGLSISPLFNLNQVSENSYAGFSGGITLEIPIYKSFDVYTGVLYSDQSFNLYEANNQVMDFLDSTTTEAITSENLYIKHLEIPINIKYNFKIGDNKLFITTGFLSSANISDKLDKEVSSYSFDVSAGQFDIQTEELSSSNTSTEFKFLSALTLSFGIEIPIIKDKHSISIEPFYKYYLKSVSQQKLNLNSGGIQLRYTFGLKKELDIDTE